MKKILIFAFMFLFVASIAAFAAPAADTGKKAPSPAQLAQQEKMKTCNAEAKALKGDERKKFMSECLKKKPAEAAPVVMTQQEKMKKCNVDAKGLKGDERKKFMSECLKKK